MGQTASAPLPPVHSKAVREQQQLPAMRVISLPHDVARRKVFQERNESVLRSFVWSFVEAVDGKELHSDEVNSCVILPPDRKWFQPGAIGCALSHLDRWEECRKSGRPLLVLEDDAVLHADFVRAYHQVIQQQLKDVAWDIVLLSYNFDAEVVVQGSPSLRCRTEKKAMRAKEFLADPLPTWLPVGRLLVAFGTCAYVVTPTGANKLIDLVFPLQRKPLPFTNNKIHSSTVDGMMNTVYHVLQSYICLSPLAITEKGTECYSSTI